MRTLIFLLISCSVSFGQFTLRNPAFVASIKAPAAGGGAFSPSDISGLLAWYRASDLALSDNALVSSWADKSANANNLSQATTVNQPRFKANYLDSKGAVWFTNAGNWLNLGTPLDNVRSVVSVEIWESPTDTIFWMGDPTYYDFHGGGDPTMFDPEYSSGSVTNGQWYSNSVNYVVSAARKNTLNVSVNILTTSGDVHVGSISRDRTQSNRSFSGYRLEVLIYSVVLSSQNRTDLAAYFEGQYPSLP